jgi:hypothetical protein
MFLEQICLKYSAGCRELGINCVSGDGQVDRWPTVGATEIPFTSLAIGHEVFKFTLLLLGRLRS